MTPEDFPEFDAAFTDMMDVLSAGKFEPSARISGLWARVLAPYPLAAVLAGIEAHMRAPDTGRTLPIPADIIKQINAAVANDGRPGADEAWSIAAPSVDEGATVVWTEEIAEAWGHARPVITALRDEVGARVAFRDVYNRIVHEARCARRPMVWLAALGTDRARQAGAIRAAVGMGRLPAAALAELEALPAPRQPLGVLLLAGDGIERDADGRRGPTDEDRKRIAEALARLSAPNDGPSLAEIERERTEGLKREAQRKVDEHLATEGVGGGRSDP